MDPSPHDHHQSTCAKEVLSDALDDLPGDTWTHRECPIFIGQAKQAELMSHDLRSWGTRGRIVTHLGALMAIGWQKLNDHEIVAHDRRVIVAHNNRVIVAIN